jgi:hypothetical protein
LPNYERRTHLHFAGKPRQTRIDEAAYLAPPPHPFDDLEVARAIEAGEVGDLEADRRVVDMPPFSRERTPVL